ncbi:MAG: coniferyl aldehyde dehydrogenase [Phyllobacterium sp.]
MEREAEDTEIAMMQQVFDRQVDWTRTRPAPRLEDRLERLDRLKKLILDHENRLCQAISDDFGHRSKVETSVAEISFVLTEIGHAKRHLKKWMAPQNIPTQLQFQPGKNRLIPQPLGVVGIISPWNYPLQLSLAPAIGAFAAGNSVMLKPSELVPRFATLLQSIVAETFVPTEFTVTGVEGGIAEAFAALPFDHLMFTGSTRVGRLVAEAAGRNLTPVTLELGGKSPAIIDASADVAVAAERIAYGKLLNAGQTCIAPDYVLIAQDRMDVFADRLRQSIGRLYGSDPANPDYSSIITERHYERLEGLVSEASAQGARVIQIASPADPAWKSRRKFPPTLVLGAAPSMKVMQEEIFGPVLPVMACESGADAIGHINSGDRPLALYWFGEDDKARDDILSGTISGGVTINDCLFHFAQGNQPMGGVGASGSGVYHGEWGFNTFSKMKPVFYRSRFSQLSNLYPPYGRKITFLQKMMRFLA